MLLQTGSGRVVSCDMAIDAVELTSLAFLLRAEMAACRLSPEALLHRYALAARCAPGRRDRYQTLARAVEQASGTASSACPAVAAFVERVGRLSLPAASQEGPILLVFESRPFRPNLDSFSDLIALRLLAAMQARGREAWILRLPSRRPGLLSWMLDRLAGRPAGVVAIDVSHPACLEILCRNAPTVTLSARVPLGLPLRRVEHDFQGEAAEIAALAAARRTDQICLIGPICRVAGRRRVHSRAVRFAGALVAELQHTPITVPANLIAWVDNDRPLGRMHVLEEIRPCPARTLVIASAGSATEAARLLAGADHVSVIGRHWSAPSSGTLPVIGPDLDAIATAALVRLFEPGHYQPNVAVLVPPAWHCRP